MMNDNPASGVWPPPPADGTMFLETLPLDALENFPSQSVLLLLILNVVTLGIYGVFWLYRMAIRLNSILRERRIAPGFAAAALVIAVTSAALDVADNVVSLSFVHEATDVSDLLFLILTLMLTFQIRYGLNRLLETRHRDAYWFSGGWTLFFGVYYLQYKINQDLQRWHRERAELLA